MLNSLNINNWPSCPYKTYTQLWSFSVRHAQTTTRARRGISTFARASPSNTEAENVSNILNFYVTYHFITHYLTKLIPSAPMYNSACVWASRECARTPASLRGGSGYILGVVVRRRAFCSLENIWVWLCLIKISLPEMSCNQLKAVNYI